MASVTVFKGSQEGVARKHTANKPDELKGDFVLVRVTASGVCGTDLHYKTQDMVLGHEGAGIVEAVGPTVKYLKPGTRVGWGYETDSCEHCQECLQGAEVFCPERALYGVKNLDQGSFASHAVVREAFLHLIPDAINDVDAAPLQCGGATVFTALLEAKPGETVGIMGVGGLGHLAIQFASKMGLHVVVLSGTDSKRAQAMELGAHKFIAMKGANAAKEIEELGKTSPLSRLLVTMAVQPAWDLILQMMAPRARVYPLSVAGGNLEFPYMPIILSGIRIQGSLVATRAVHRDMLTFAARHGIRPVVETFPMTEEGIKAAMEKLDKGNVQFRAVLVPQ